MPADWAPKSSCAQCRDSLSHPFVLFGDLEVLEFALGKLNFNLALNPITSLEASNLNT